MKKLLLYVTLFITLLNANATHIASGNMYCAFDRIDSAGNYVYVLTIELYRDCNSSTVGFDNNIDVGIYLFGGLHISSVMTLTKEEEATIQAITDTSKHNFCYKKAYYTKAITLPTLANYYTAVFQRCCRPTLANISDYDIGSTYFVTISQVRTNSSPKEFLSAPYVINVGQKQVLSLGNTDIDEDVLTYKLISAIQGGSATNPQPVPALLINLPFSQTPYRNNYSGKAPMGSLPAYAKLDSLTGQLEVFTFMQGNYVIAYEVGEWRDGSLINTNYREAYISVITGYSTKNNSILLNAKGLNNGKEEVQTFWSHNIAATIDSFVLERSPDNSSWAPVGGTSSSLLNFKDGAVTANQEYWYRVYADTGGGKVYSNVVKVGVDGNGVSLNTGSKAKTETKIYPNPARNNLFFEFPENYQPKKISISNTLGQIVLEHYFKAGENTNSINIEQLPKGLYVLIATFNSDIVISRRFYKE